MAERKKTGHCTANTPDGKQCPCKAYDDPDNPPHGIPVVCRECCHGKSNHDGSPPTGVCGVFKNLLDKDGEAYQKARLETNSNLKKVEAESKITKKSKGGQKKSTMASVGNIVAITAGLDEKGHLKEHTAPTPLIQQQLEKKGLAVTYGSSGKLLHYGKEWGPMKMNAFLRSHLPGLFAILGKTDPWINTVGDDDENEKGGREWPYVLLTKVKKSLEVTPAQTLTGARALQNKGRGGLSPDNTYIWIGTRRTIKKKEIWQYLSVLAARETQDNLDTSVETNRSDSKAIASKKKGKGKEKAVISESGSDGDSSSDSGHIVDDDELEESDSESEDVKPSKSSWQQPLPLFLETDEDDNNIVNTVQPQAGTSTAVLKKRSLSPVAGPSQKRIKTGAMASFGESPLSDLTSLSPIFPFQDIIDISEDNDISESIVAPVPPFPIDMMLQSPTEEKSDYSYMAPNPWDSGRKVTLKFLK